MRGQRSPIDAYLRSLSIRLWVTAPLRRRAILREVEDHLREAAVGSGDGSQDVVASERRAVERFGRYPVGRSVAVGVVIGTLGVAGLAVWMGESPNTAQAHVVRASVTYVGWPKADYDELWPVVASVHPNQYQLPLSVITRELPTGKRPPNPLPGSCGPRHILVSLLWSDGTHRSYALCTAPESIHRVRDKLYTTYIRSAALRRYLRAQYEREVRHERPLPRAAVPSPAQVSISGGTRAERGLLRRVLARMPAGGIAVSHLQIQDAPTRRLILTLDSPPLPAPAGQPPDARAGWAFATNQWAGIVLTAAFNHLARSHGIAPLASAWTNYYGPVLSSNRFPEVAASHKPLDRIVLKQMAREAHVRLVDASFGPLGYGELIRFRIADPHNAQQAMYKLHLPRYVPLPAELQLENPCGTPIAVLQDLPGEGGVWTDDAWLAQGTDTITGRLSMFNTGPVYPATACG